MECSRGVVDEAYGGCLGSGVQRRLFKPPAFFFSVALGLCFGGGGGWVSLKALKEAIYLKRSQVSERSMNFF